MPFGLSGAEGKAREHSLTRRVLWKLDIHILPPLALLWLANFIDRTNVGNARIAGLESDTHMKGNQFNTALAVFYVSYILVELPSNWVLKKMRPNRWLPLLVCLWGMVTTLSGLVQSFGGLVAVRIVLGICEGGILPGMMLYLSTIYKRHELQLRVGIFYASASLSGAFGGLLASAIIKMGGIAGLEGWRWIFILEGIATCLVGAAAALVLPEGISTAKFLTEEEREFAESSRGITDKEKEGELMTEVYDTNNAVVVVHQEEEQFEWREIIRGLVDVQAWLTGIAYLGIIVSLYSYSLFLPTIVAELGYSVVVAFLADRYKLRGPLIMICLPVNIAGYIMVIAAKSNEVRYAAVFLIAAGLYPTAPCILSIIPNNTSGHYKKATASALSLAVANTGGFVATFVYTQGK
ncbi:hypothetical protein EWM64_g2564 [Hericium alpestre]|uniref:Major facilitator superfamily (MFS) profile domain-containing protein n=1 Tax=Hericium alpestre TaxID=135208 RepID=A0A4Z0A4R4_9AGAM|nr:hypothetical protein EWM64_g2564 [Hericium alpestre]